ncbi:MAG: hypothetical protein QM817_41780 [Archangium sp.]
MAEFVDSICGSARVRVERSICETATERVHWKRFVAPADGVEPALTVFRHSALDGKLIDAPLGKCVFVRDGARLDVQFEDGMFRGELVLRLGWYLCGTEQGAVLIHANALSDGTHALVAAGQSGNGKSTLARLGVGAGLSLLTDEVVMLFPDGRVSGTPFRSDFDNAGQPGLMPAKYFVALEKAPREELKPLSALEAVQLAMAQCFEIAEVAIPRVEVRQRLLTFLSKVQLGTFAFRKHDDAGAFARSLLAGGAA